MIIQNLFVITMPTSINSIPTLLVGREWLKIGNPEINWLANVIKIQRDDGSRWILSPRKEKPHQSKVSLKLISFKKRPKIILKRTAELFPLPLKPEAPKHNSIPEQASSLVQEVLEVFKEELYNGILSRPSINFEMKTQIDSSPPVYPLMRLSAEELEELTKQLDKLLRKGLIRPPSSPYSEYEHFVRKKGTDLRMVCD